MKSKKYNILMLFIIVALDAVYLREIFTTPVSKMTIISPYLFPKIIGIALLVLCAVQLLITLMSHEDEKISVNNIWLIVGTVIATAGLLLLWRLLGVFYILAFIYLSVLMFMYRDENRFGRKNIIINFAFAAGMDLIIFILFNLLLKIRL